MLARTPAASLAVAVLFPLGLPLLAQCPATQTRRINVDTLSEPVRQRIEVFRRAENFDFANNNLGALLESLWPGWYRNLPACPCSEPANNALWESSNLFIAKFHPGANTCYRSQPCAPALEFVVGPAGKEEVISPRHGQQCCYDKNGFLMTQGPAAGTPDFYSPADRDRHMTYDVEPWERMGWRLYALQWRPNQGSGCEIQFKADSRRFTTTHMYVEKGQTLRISATGKIRWYGFFNALTNKSLAPTGPEGFAGKPEDLGYYMATPLPKERIGSLIGWIGADLPEPRSLPGSVLLDAAIVDPNQLSDKERTTRGRFIPIGAKTSVPLPATGMLWLSVNDGALGNNDGAFQIDLGNPPR